MYEPFILILAPFNPFVTEPLNVSSLDVSFISKIKYCAFTDLRYVGSVST